MAKHPPEVRRRWQTYRAAYLRRMREGLMVAPVETSPATVELLIELGLLDPLQDEDRRAVGRAMTRHFEILDRTRNQY